MLKINSHLFPKFDMNMYAESRDMTNYRYFKRIAFTESVNNYFKIKYNDEDIFQDVIGKAFEVNTYNDTTIAASTDIKGKIHLEELAECGDYQEISKQEFNLLAGNL